MNLLTLKLKALLAVLGAGSLTELRRALLVLAAAIETEETPWG